MVIADAIVHAIDPPFLFFSPSAGGGANPGLSGGSGGSCGSR